MSQELPQIPNLWTSRLAEISGLEKAVRPYWDSEYAGPLALILVLEGFIFVLTLIGYFRTGRNVLFTADYPFVIGGMIYSVLTSIYLRNRLETAVESFDDRIDQNSLFLGIGNRLKYVLVILGAAILVSTIALSPGSTRTFLELEGPIVGSTKYVFNMLVRIPILVEFGYLILLINIVIPTRIWQLNVPLDFSDPRGFGGFYQVGKALVRSAMAYFIGLLFLSGWSLIHLFVGTPYPNPANDVTVWIFYVLWAGLVLIYAIPVRFLHRHMKRHKEDEVANLQDSIRELGTDEYAFPYTKSPEDQFEEHLELYNKLSYVQSAREYPADFELVQELVLAAIIPLLGHVIVTVIASGGAH